MTDTIWRYSEEKCEGEYCCQDCDKCPIADEDEVEE